MQNKKYLGLMGSVCTFMALGGGGIVHAQDLSELVKASALTTCTAGTSYACFKLGSTTLRNNGTLKDDGDNDITIPTSSSSISSSDWKSFGGTSPNFTSTSDKQGQTTSATGNNTLNLDLNNSTLKLTKLGTSNDTKINLPIMLYVSGQSSGDNLLTIKTNNSVLIGNIQIASDGGKRGLAKMEFTGNKAIQTDDTKLLGSYKLKPEVGKSYAFVGMFFNNAGGEANLAFKNGAKMFGDVRSVSATQSKTTLTFEGDYTTDEYAFEGALTSQTGGSNILEFKNGDAIFHSTAYGTYGIQAYNDGKNQITFSDNKKAQNMKVLIFLATNDAVSGFNKVDTTKNTVIFSNRQTNNTFTAFADDRSQYSGYIRATSAVSEIFTQNTSTTLKLVADRGIVTQANQADTNADSSKITNTIIIDGSIQAGLESVGYLTHGIVAYAGTTKIYLTTTSGTTNSSASYTPGTYSANRSLEATQISASGTITFQNDADSTKRKLFQGKNEIKLNGDLTLSFFDNQGVVNGGTISANSGGKNEIEVEGAIKLAEVKKGETITSSSATPTVETLVISAGTGTYFSDANTEKGKNNIVVKNNNNGGEDITLGGVYSTGGENTVQLNGGRDKTTKILSISALSGIATKQVDSTQITVNGENKIAITGGANTNLESILAQSGGTNQIAIQDTTNVTLDSMVAEDGNNELYVFGGTNIAVSNVLTSGSSGQSKIAILRKTNKGDAQTSNIRYSYGIDGSNQLYLGDAKSDSTADYAKISLGNNSVENNLDVKVERDTGKFDVTFGNGTDFSYFFGDIDTTNKGSLTPKFYVENNAIFTPNTMGKTKTQADIDLTLKAGGKMVLANDFSISNLTVEKSTAQTTDYLANTKNLGSTVIDLATGGGDYLNISKESGTTLTITNLTLNGSGNGNALLRVYSGGETTNTDKVAVTNLTATSKTLDTQVFLPLHLIGQDLSAKNLVIFSTTTGGDNLELVSKEAKTGFATYTAEIEKEPASGGSPTNWKLAGTSNARVALGASDYSNVIIPLNYTNWNANINSLNKRMGELRDNPYNQGVWARVFVGEQSNSQGSATINMGYLTLQGGYDYGIALDDAKNYIGLSVAYGMSSAQSDKFVDQFNHDYQYDAKSSNIEVGLYNSYVQNSGLYTDSILKFSYISSDFYGINANSANTTVANYALSFGQEVGYRLKFGEKMDWYFDPQFEGVLGYFSDTDFDQSFEQQILNSTMNAMFLLRARVGADLGYSLKTTKGTYDFRAGLSYVYDYANGDAKYNILNSSVATLVENGVVTSDQRLVLNLGTNMQINDEVRLYVDFETSFLGEINTKYQVNAGVRYSFGEKIQAQILEEKEKQENVAPLKIQDSKETQPKEDTTKQVSKKDTTKQNQKKQNK